MKLDEVLSNSRRLEAPASLRDRVMSAVESDRATRGAWTGRIPRLMKKPIFKPVAAFAACAAALLLVVMSSQGENEKVAVNSAKPAVSELDLFLEEALGTVYGIQSMEISAEYPVEEDESRFITSSINQLFWFNGGDNA